MMVKMFGSFSDGSIVIFDNILLLAHDAVDTARKLRALLDKCVEHNVFLKPSKSFFGFSSV